MTISKDEKIQDLTGIDGVEASGNGIKTSLAQPAIKFLGQYIKDLSFENPHAPGSLAVANPEVSVSVNVGARPLGGSDFEVELKLSVNAAKNEKTAFMVELVYGGAVRLENISDELRQAVLLIECPRMLFPFARQTLATLTQSGGFPAVMLDPIDFSKLFQAKNSSSREN